MIFPKASAMLLCAAALSAAISIPDVGYHVAGVAARSPQGFGQGGNSSGGQGFNKAQGNNNANKNNGGGNAKSSTSTSAAAATATKAATGNNGNNNAAAAATGGSQCLKANAVQTGSAADGNNPPVQDQAASAT
jgi:hypothetical protein